MSIEKKIKNRTSLHLVRKRENQIASRCDQLKKGIHDL